MAEFTVVFADLTDSTALFETVGNVKATETITGLTSWIGEVCENYHGRVVKYMGDGVLLLFSQSLDAIEAVVELQQLHQKRIQFWPDALKMRLQVGVARGNIVEQQGDYYGDAVNLASRLSDLSGPEQILVTDAVIQELPKNSRLRSHSLGALAIRGRSDACVVHQIEWQSGLSTDAFTLPGRLLPHPFAGYSASSTFIELSWLDITAEFTSIALPVFMGRDINAQLVVTDPRVSRRHARINWHAGKFHLEDTSSYGTWLRFSDSAAIIFLRRQECALPMAGEIALGASFDDLTAPTVMFKFHPGRYARQ